MSRSRDAYTLCITKLALTQEQPRSQILAEVRGLLGLPGSLMQPKSERTNQNNFFSSLGRLRQTPYLSLIVFIRQAERKNAIVWCEIN